MARNHISSLWGTTRYNVLAYTYKNNQLTMSQPKSNEELIEEFNKLHTVSVAIQSGMMVGNNTEEECIKSYERLEQFFSEALAQKDAKVADWQESLEVVAHRFEKRYPNVKVE